MLLLCNMKFFTPSEGFLKNVETKVWFIKPDGDAFIEYNLTNHKEFKSVGLMEKLYDIVNKKDLERKDYMDCREVK